MAGTEEIQHQWDVVRDTTLNYIQTNPQTTSFIAGGVAFALIIYGIKGFSVLEEHYKNKKQRAQRVAKGMSMTTPEQENRERVLMADGITDVLEDYEYLGKMTRERVMVWYRRFGNLLNLPDLLEKHEKLMKDILRKKYPKGKLGNVVVMPIPDAAPEAPRGNGLLSRLRAKV